MSSHIDHELDVHEKILDRVNTWFTPSIVQQIRDDIPTPTCAEALRVLSLLPAKASMNFARVRPTKLVIPRDHNMHYLQELERYTLLMNGTTKSGRRVAITSTIQRRSITPASPGMFSLEKNNELFHSSFSITIGKTTGKEGAHWYFEGDGGLLGVYTPGVHDELPYVTIKTKGRTEGLLKAVRSDENQLVSQWKMTGESGESGENKGSIDLKLRLSKSEVKSTGEHNKMMYYFPKVSVTGLISIPGGSDSGPREQTEIIGTATLLHVGCQSKERQPRMNLFIQFPALNMTITGTSAVTGKVSKGAEFPVSGTVQKGTTQEQYFNAGVVSVKDVFKSSSTGVTYPTELELSIGNKVVSLTPIYKDQRQFDPSLCETWSGGVNATLLSALNTTKPQGVGFVVVSHLLSPTIMKSSQLKKLKLAPLEGSLATHIRNSSLTQTAQVEKYTSSRRVSKDQIAIIICCSLIFLLIIAAFYYKNKLA
jgi:hypothetical protein